MAITLTLAHSPDPDDVFMWWPITGMIDPCEHSRVVRGPTIDTGQYRFVALPADIAVLNRRAIEVGDLPITALSIFAWAKCADRYALTDCGGSFGDGYGPKIVTRGGGEGAGLAGLDASREALERLLRDRPGGLPALAIPGRSTTACALTCMLLGWDAARLERELVSGAVIERPFDQLADLVSEGKAGAAVLIHQSQLTFSDMGLRSLVDLGEWWRRWTGLTLPLGGNAVKRTIDSPLGVPGESLRIIAGLLDRSIRYAAEHREEGIRYAMGFAPDLDRSQAGRYIDMYVSPATLSAGAAGLAAIRRLLEESHARGLIDAPPRGVRSWGDVELVRPA